MIIKKAVILVASGIAGGIAGYLVTDLLIYKFEERRISKNIVEEFQNQLKEYKPEDLEDVIDYTNFAKSKARLEDLVAPYLKADSEVKDLSVPLYEIISHEEYTDQGYSDQYTIMFYEGDDTYTLDDEILASPSDYIGPREGLKFGEKSSDPDVVYIRNNDMEADYEVICVHGKYSTLVLGMSEEEADQKPKRKRKSSNGTE